MSGSDLLHLLGLAKKAGRLEIGEEPVGAGCRARQVKLVLTAADAADNSRRRARHFAEIGNAEIAECPCSKAELGGLLGRNTCAMVGLTDAGFAAAICAKLAQADAARYGETAKRLQEKAEKVHQRQKEQRQHEKNLRRGKKKPWAPPPERKPDPGPKKSAKAPSAGRPAGRVVQLRGKLPGAKKEP